MPDERLIPKMPGPLGYSAALDRMGTAAAPLLAGFAFTLIGLIVTSNLGVAQSNLALGLLVAAALLLINAVQFAFSARQFYVPPGEFLDLIKVGQGDEVSEADLRRMLANWLPIHKKWLGRARVAYNAGIVLLLAGVAVTLIPPGPLSRVSDLRLAAAAIAAAGAVVEALGSVVPAVRDALATRSESGADADPPQTIDETAEETAGVAPAARLQHQSPEPATPHPPVQPPAPPADRTTDADASTPAPMPNWIFWVEVAWLVALIAVFVLYHVSDPVRDALPATLGAKIPVEAPWFGALGGCLISLSGIFDHNREWDAKFNYWHPIRPLVGAVTGGIGCVLLLVTTELATTGTVRTEPVFYDGVAFVFGYAEAAFRSLIKSVTNVILKPGS